jgi:hypothetical protein
MHITSSNWFQHSPMDITLIDSLPIVLFPISLLNSPVQIVAFQWGSSKWRQSGLGPKLSLASPVAGRAWKLGPWMRNMYVLCFICRWIQKHPALPFVQFLCLATPGTNHSLRLVAFSPWWLTTSLPFVERDSHQPVNCSRNLSLAIKALLCGWPELCQWHTLVSLVPPHRI